MSNVQDSVIFSGSLRFNLDPMEERGEEELVATLSRLGKEGRCE